MAEVMRIPGLPEQVWLVMVLRWRMFRHGLRSVSAKLHMIGMIVTGLMWGLISVGVGVGIGVGSYFLMQRMQLQILGLILWGIFLFWQVFPILAAQFAPNFDSSSMLRFPLRFSSFFAINLGYGLADPTALTGVLWHLALLAGIGLARPELLPGAALVVFLSVAMNLLLGRMIFTWLERLLAQRRTREYMFVLFFVAVIALQFSGVVVQKWGHPLGGFFQRTMGFWSALPPGRAGSAISAFALWYTSEALVSCAALLLYAAAFGALLAYRLHAEFLGENFGESAAPAQRKATAPAKVRSAAPAAASAGIFAGVVCGPVAAVFLKEFRYLYRNTIMLLNLFLPLILIVFFAVTWKTNGPKDTFLHGRLANIGFAYPGAVAYTFL
ncbi:MAG: hypothetical protein ACRD5L_14385, partial [Bryobacteraceae bacterium]